MDLLVNSSDDDVMAVTAEETAIGIPDLKSVTFMVDGYVTEPVSTDATADIVESAVLSLFGPLCSQKIEKLLAKKPVIFRKWALLGQRGLHCLILKTETRFKMYSELWN